MIHPTHRATNTHRLGGSIAALAAGGVAMTLGFTPIASAVPLKADSPVVSSVGAPCTLEQHSRALTAVIPNVCSQWTRDIPGQRTLGTGLYPRVGANGGRA
jgi:hypothetical protein